MREQRGLATSDDRYLAGQRTYATPVQGVRSSSLIPGERLARGRREHGSSTAVPATQSGEARIRRGQLKAAPLQPQVHKVPPTEARSRFQLSAQPRAPTRNRIVRALVVWLPRPHHSVHCGAGSHSPCHLAVCLTLPSNGHTTAGHNVPLRQGWCRRRVPLMSNVRRLHSWTQKTSFTGFALC